MYQHLLLNVSKATPFVSSLGTKYPNLEVFAITGEYADNAVLEVTACSAESRAASPNYAFQLCESSMGPRRFDRSR